METDYELIINGPLAIQHGMVDMLEGLRSMQADGFAITYTRDGFTIFECTFDSGKKGKSFQLKTPQQVIEFMRDKNWIL